MFTERNRRPAAVLSFRDSDTLKHVAGVARRRHHLRRLGGVRAARKRAAFRQTSGAGARPTDAAFASESILLVPIFSVQDFFSDKVDAGQLLRGGTR